MTRRIALTNTVVLNGGDAAIAAAIIAALREIDPNAQIEVHDLQPDVAARYYPSLCFAPSLASIRKVRPDRRPGSRVINTLNRHRILSGARALRHAALQPIASVVLRKGELSRLRDYAEIDLVVSTGGTYLLEIYDIEPRLFELELAQALGVPVVLFTQSIGRFRDRRRRRRLRKLVRGAALVLLRDEISRRHVADLGVVDRHIHVVPDAVFGPAPVRVAPRREASSARSVAISVRRWPPWGDASHPQVTAFRDAVATTVTWLVRDHAARVTFLSTCQGVPEYWMDDSAVACEIVAGLPLDVLDSVDVDRAFHPPDLLTRRYADFDMLIATRMHAGILALTVGTPVLPIAYEFKTSALFEAMHLGEHVIRIEEISEDRLLNHCRAFIEELPRLRRAFEENVALQHADARRAQDLLRCVVEGTSNTDYRGSTAGTTSVRDARADRTDGCS
jgi:colanic acid/amylovoran biosynthesis protein